VDAAEEYLQLLALRFDKATRPTDAHLRTELLGVMSRLCSHGTYRDRSAQIFWGRFLRGIQDTKNDAARRSAVLGLIRIDKAGALEVFRKQDFYHDSSAAVRLAVMELSGEVGGMGDLAPLMSRLQENGDQETAWKAFSTILSRQDASVVLKWALQIRELELEEKADVLLAQAEKKADNNRDADTLVRVRKILAEQYASRGENQKAVLYYKELLPTVLEPQERETLELGLVQAALLSGQDTEVGQIVAERLKKGDFSTEDAIMLSVQNYFQSDQIAHERKVTLLQAMTNVSVPDGRPIWAQTLRDWQKKTTDGASAAAEEVTTENPG
jgi:hypothetical protein